MAQSSTSEQIPQYTHPLLHLAHDFPKAKTSNDSGHERAGFSVSPTPHQHLSSFLLFDCFFSLGIAAFVVIAPLEVFATLQRLNLCPDSALLPRLWAMIPFSSLSPFQRWLPNTQRTFGTFSKALISSPFILLWLLVNVKSCVNKRIYVYVRWLIPKPINWTFNSELAAKGDDLTSGVLPSRPLNDDSQKTSDYFTRAYRRVLNIPSILTRWAQSQTHISINENDVYGIPQSANETNTQLLGRDENIHLSNTLGVTSQLHESPSAQRVPSPREFDHVSQSTDNFRPPALEDEPVSAWHEGNVAQAVCRPTETVDSSKYHQMSISA